MIPWHTRQLAIVTFCLAHDVSTELSERLLIICVRSPVAIFPDDAVLGYGSYSGNHTETYLRSYILHFQQ
ncbi:MAG: hypothetical protein PUH68_05645, partial [Bacteroidales bacterium]|nr:hypothetical protein [Bacteroidales bacterium]